MRSRRPRPVAVAPVQLNHSSALRRMLSQTRFGPLDLLIIDLAPGIEEPLPDDADASRRPA